MARIATIEKKELCLRNTTDLRGNCAKPGGGRRAILALLHSPELAGRTAHLGSFVRFESSWIQSHRTRRAGFGARAPMQA